MAEHLRRWLSGQVLLEGSALAVYIPRRGRQGRHYADAFSSALWLAKTIPDLGERYAWDNAAALAELLPQGTTMIVCPPASRKRRAAGFYFARELAAAVASRAGLTLGRPLTWEAEDIAGAGAGKEIMTQRGQGRKLARTALCWEDLAGQSVCIVDDLFTTGITAALTAEALYRAGASLVTLVTLGVTERTSQRPAVEREILRLKANARSVARGG